MTREEAIKELQKGMPTENATDEECERYVEAYNMAIKALETLEFAKKELQFAVEHTRGKTKDHYQRALNLLIKENKQ